MSMDFAGVLVDFHTFNPNGDANEKQFYGETSFGRPIRKATAVMSAFELNYTEGDHNIKDICVGCEARVDSLEHGDVTVMIKVKFADEGFDDPVDGWVSVVVFADVA